MKCVISLLLTFIAINAYAAGEYAPQLTEVNVQFEKFVTEGYAPYFTTSPQRNRITLNMDVSLAKYFYWENTVHGSTDDTQYRFIGWQTSVGLHAHEQLDIFFRHHSQHVLDSNRGYWPEEDSVGIKLYLYRGRTGDSLF